jgi:hypothetical protein
MTTLKKLWLKNRSKQSTFIGKLWVLKIIREIQNVYLSVLREWRIPGDFFWSGYLFYIDIFQLDYWNIHLKRLTSAHHIIMAVMNWRHSWLVLAVRTGFVLGKNSDTVAGF